MFVGIFRVLVGKLFIEVLTFSNTQLDVGGGTLIATWTQYLTKLYYIICAKSVDKFKDQEIGLDAVCVQDTNSRESE